MGLWDRRSDPAGTFSKGMKQRLALARALLHEPAVLFLDEPSSGLDPEAAGEVRNLISRLKGEGRTIFLSTHNLTEAEQLCDRIAIFRKNLLALDTPANLKHRLFHRRARIRLDKASPEIVVSIKNLEFVSEIEQSGDVISVDLADIDKYLPELIQVIVQSGGRLLEVTEEQHSLEKAYLAMVREEKE